MLTIRYRIGTNNLNHNHNNEIGYCHYNGILDMSTFFNDTLCICQHYKDTLYHYQDRKGTRTGVGAWQIRLYITMLNVILRMRKLLLTHSNWLPPLLLLLLWLLSLSVVITKVPKLLPYVQCNWCWTGFCLLSLLSLPYPYKPRNYITHAVQHNT